MSMTDLRSAFRVLRTLLLTLMAIAGLMLCLTAMHALPAKHAENVGTMTAAAPAGHLGVQSAQVAGAVGAAIACPGPCDQDHFMLAASCATALLIPLVFIGAARSNAAWSPLARSMSWLARTVGASPPPRPPSLHFLSISRT